jgi:hypothetical protein
VGFEIIFNATKTLETADNSRFSRGQHLGLGLAGQATRWAISRRLGFMEGVRGKLWSGQTV